MKHKKDLRILCNNNEEKIMAVALLYSFGYQYYKSPALDVCLEEHHEDMKDDCFPNVILESGRIDLCGSNYVMSGDAKTYAFYETKRIIKFLTNHIEPITIQISADYEAVISKDGIQVGCQNISFAVFAELVEAVNTVRNN